MVIYSLTKTSTICNSDALSQAAWLEFVERGLQSNLKGGISNDSKPNFLSATE